jgi:hypothetical protein
VGGLALQEAAMKRYRKERALRVGDCVTSETNYFFKLAHEEHYCFL